MINVIADIYSRPNHCAAPDFSMAVNQVIKNNERAEVIMTTRHLVLNSFIVLLSSTGSLAWEVSRLQGEANLINGSNSTPLSVGQSLKDESLIETSAKSKLELKEGSSRFTIGPKTKFVVQPAKATADSSLLKLVTGKLRAEVSVGESSKIQYRTPTAVAGVRGTEFYMATDGRSDTICTLEGMVYVKPDTSSEEIEVPAGSGLRLNRGVQAKIEPNSGSMVRTWMADTAFDVEGPVQIGSHGTVKANVYQHGESGFLGATGQVLSRMNTNYDFNLDQENNNDLTSTQTRLEPYLQVGDQWEVFWSPLVYHHNSTVTTVVDNYPLARGTQRTGVIPGRIHFGWNRPDSTLRLGLLRMKWGDGTHVSDSSTKIDGNTYAGASFRKVFSGWATEILLSKGLRDEIDNGISHISIYGAKIDLPSDFGQIHITQRDFGPKSTLTSVAALESHNLSDVGYFIERKFGLAEFKLQAFYQTGKLYAGESNEKSTKEGTLDFAARYFVSADPKIRVEARYVTASEDYVPGEESSYNHGLANLFSRTNIQMLRGKLDWELSDKALVTLEHINATAVGNGYLRASTWNGSQSPIGQEWDLTVAVKPLTGLSVLIGGFHFQPGPGHYIVSTTGKKDAASGAVVRANFSL